VQGIATVAAVDCDAEANKQLCGRYEIRGFPTIKVFPGDKSKGGNKTPTDYQGSATAVGLSVQQRIAKTKGQGHQNSKPSCILGLKHVLLHVAGPRSAKGIADAVTAGLHARLIQHPKDAAAFEEFRGHSALPKVMLFTDKAKSTCGLVFRYDAHTGAALELQRRAMSRSSIHSMLLCKFSST
jgi:hypothetical protein